MLEKLVFETKTFESTLGAERSLIFKVIDLGEYQVGLRTFKVIPINVGLSFYVISVLLFNCSDHLEFITVYPSQGYLKVIVKDSIKELNQEFFDKLTERFLEEEYDYKRYDCFLSDYIISSVNEIEYDLTRFTNFLWLSQQALLASKRGE